MNGFADSRAELAIERLATRAERIALAHAETMARARQAMPARADK